MPQCRWRHNGTLVSYSVAISVPCVRQFRGQLRVMLVAHLRHRHVPKAAAHIDAAVWDSSTKWQVAEARPTTDMFRERTSARRTKPEGLDATPSTRRENAATSSRREGGRSEKAGEGSKGHVLHDAREFDQSQYAARYSASKSAKQRGRGELLTPSRQHLRLELQVGRISIDLERFLLSALSCGTSALYTCF